MSWPSREALCRGQGSNTQAETLLWGPERGILGPETQGVASGDGLVHSPDSFVLEEGPRGTDREL